jgi:hypothetical protein
VAAMSRRTSGTRQCDHGRIGGWRLIGGHRHGRLRAGLVPQECGGDGADGLGGQDQDGVSQDCVVEPELGLIQAEAVLAELEFLFHWPPEPGGAVPPVMPGRLALGDLAVMEGQRAGPDMQADQQAVPG